MHTVIKNMNGVQTIIIVLMQKYPSLRWRFARSNLPAIFCGIASSFVLAMTPVRKSCTTLVLISKTLLLTNITLLHICTKFLLASTVLMLICIMLMLTSTTSVLICEKLLLTSTASLLICTTALILKNNNNKPIKP